MSAKKKTAKRGGSVRAGDPDKVRVLFRNEMRRIAKQPGRSIRIVDDPPRPTTRIETAALAKLIESEQRAWKQVDELQTRGTDLTLTSRKQAKRIGAFEGFLKALNDAVSILDEQIRAIDRGDA